MKSFIIAKELEAGDQLMTVDEHGQQALVVIQAVRTTAFGKRIFMFENGGIASVHENDEIALGAVS